MDIIYILIPVTMLFIGIAIGVFYWSVKSGQYDDVDSPASRILFDDDLEPGTSGGEKPDNSNKTQNSQVNEESKELKDNKHTPNRKNDD